MASPGDIADSGRRSIQTTVHVRMPKGKAGGYVDISPETLAGIVGCKGDHLDPCAAALSIDDLHISGANVPVDSHLIVTAVDGSPISSHSAAFIGDDGDSMGVHGNIRRGNHHAGLNIRIPMQPHSYRGDMNRQQSMDKVVTRSKNWIPHMGMTADEIIQASGAVHKKGLDSNGREQHRVLINEHSDLASTPSPLGKLVSMNSKATDGIMRVYNQHNKTVVHNKIVMSKEHVNALAHTLSDTLAPVVPLTQGGGMRIALKPMAHESNDNECIAQLDMHINRTPISEILKLDPENEDISHVTVSDIHPQDDGAPSKSAADINSEIESTMWSANLGPNEGPISNVTPVAVDEESSFTATEGST